MEAPSVRALSRVVLATLVTTLAACASEHRSARSPANDASIADASASTLDLARRRAPKAPPPVTVAGTYPAAGSTNGLLSFLSVSFSAPLDPASVTAQSVQLARQEASGAWTIVPAEVAYNPTARAVVATPTGALVAGAYVLAIYGATSKAAGVRGASGAAFNPAVYYLGFRVGYALNVPGSACGVTVFWPGNPAVGADPDPGLVGASVFGPGRSSLCGLPEYTMAGVPSLFVADQLYPMDASTINEQTIRLVPMKDDFSAATGAAVAIHPVYEPTVPTIQISILGRLKAGAYLLSMTGLRTATGVTYGAPFLVRFRVAADQAQPPPRIAAAPNVLWSYPSGDVDATAAAPCTQKNPGASTFVSTNASFGFNQRMHGVDGRTVTLHRYVGTKPVQVAVDVSYNPDLYTVNLVPTRGLPLGDYLIAIDGVTDDAGRTLSRCYLHYRFETTRADLPFPGRQFAVLPSAMPNTFLVATGSMDQDDPATINAQTVNVFDPSGKPVAVRVAYARSIGHISAVPLAPLVSGLYTIWVHDMRDRWGNAQMSSFTGTYRVP
jgi:hypothetical protein